MHLSLNGRILEWIAKLLPHHNSECWQIECIRMRGRGRTNWIQMRWVYSEVGRLLRIIWGTDISKLKDPFGYTCNRRILYNWWVRANAQKSAQRLRRKGEKRKAQSSESTTPSQSDKSGSGLRNYSVHSTYSLALENETTHRRPATLTNWRLVPSDVKGKVRKTPAWEGKHEIGINGT